MSSRNSPVGDDGIDITYSLATLADVFDTGFPGA